MGHTALEETPEIEDTSGESWAPLSSTTTSIVPLKPGTGCRPMPISSPPSYTALEGCRLLRARALGGVITPVDGGIRDECVELGVAEG